MRPRGVSAWWWRAWPPLARVFEMMAATFFFCLDGHHVFLGVMHGTFLRFPLGEGLSLTPLATLVDGVNLAQEEALLLAAPVGLVLFLVTIVLLLLARA